MPDGRIALIVSAIDYMEAHLTEKLNLETVSTAVHYSKYHLHRVFTSTVGLTIHDYLQRRKLTEAAKLLVFSDKPILDIALLAGYESQQAFTDIFTAMYKQPPSKFRENKRFYPLQLKFEFGGTPAIPAGGDKADTGHRKEIQTLGFAEAENLIEYGYPTQRFILPQDRPRP